MIRPPTTPSWRWWAAVTGAAILLRALVAFVLLRGMPLVGDARDYFEEGLRLAAGDNAHAFYWPPGESVVLAWSFALLGKSVLAARLATVATSVACVVVTALLARDLAGDRAGRWGGWMAAAYPPAVLLSGQTYAQHLAALCLVAVAWLAPRAVREGRLATFAVTGFALGFGCLTRPSMASVAPVVAAFWILAAYGDRARHARFARIVAGSAVAAFVALATVAPVLAHDARAGAGWTLSTNNERNFFLGNNPYTPDYKTSHLGQRSLDELAPDARAYLESYYARSDARAAMAHAAFTYMTSHPARTAIRSFNRATSFWGFDYLASRDIQDWRGWGGAKAAVLVAVEGGSYLVVMALALLAVFARGDGRRPGMRAWLVALALAYEAPYVVAFSGGTYHFPVVPLAIALAGAAAVRRQRPTKGAFVAVIALVAVQIQYGYWALAMR